MNPYFLMLDLDGRVGVFTWDPQHARGLELPLRAALHGAVDLPEVPLRTLLRKAACLQAGAEAMAAGEVGPAGGERPLMAVVVDPPEDLVAMREVEASWSLPRPVVLLHDGSPEQAWVLAEQAGGWIDVFKAWDAPERPTGLARYGAVNPYGAAPEGMSPASSFERLDPVTTPAFRSDDLPVSLAGTITRVPLRFAELEHVDLAAHLDCVPVGPAEAPPPRRKDPTVLIALGAIVALWLVLSLVLG